MKIGDEVYVHGYIDEIRNDIIIIRNDGGYFGTIPNEVAKYTKPHIYGKQADTIIIDKSNLSESPHECETCSHQGEFNNMCKTCSIYFGDSNYEPKDESTKYRIIHSILQGQSGNEGVEYEILDGFTTYKEAQEQIEIMPHNGWHNYKIEEIK
jgi:hypothetical protein